MQGKPSQVIASILFFVIIFGTLSMCTNMAQSADLLSTMNRYQGMNEHKHRKQLRSILGVDPVRTAWCGAMATFVVKKHGMKPPAGSLKASSWKGWRRPAQRNKSNIGKAMAVVRGGSHVGVYAGIDRLGRTCVSAGNTSNGVRRACYSGKYWIRK